MGLLSKLGLGFAVLSIASATWVALEGHRRFTGPGPLAQDGAVMINKNSSLESIAKSLTAAGVVYDPYSFMVGVKLRKGHLKAGEFSIPSHASAQTVMEILQDGKTITHKLTIAEGLTVKKILADIQDAPFLAGSISHKPSEGHLLPETWLLQRDDDRNEVVLRMEKAMNHYLDQAWAGKSANLPLKNKEEALVLASIVERETALPQERPKVAAVFLNRLRQGMKLQSDPTVIYGLSDGNGTLDHSLTRSDLDSNHPWNTYVIAALPPSPISNPGKASLDAVLHPASSDALYFVADGKGGHNFARTLDEHNRNVAAWRKGKAAAASEDEEQSCSPSFPKAPAAKLLKK